LSVQHVICFLFAFWISTDAWGQDCATPGYLRQVLQERPHLREAIDIQEDRLRQWIRDREMQAVPREVVTIPVVVHIVHRTDEDNIPDEQVYAQLEVLNRDYRALNADLTLVPQEFQGTIADVELEFCLASADPQGAPSTGITRTRTDFERVGREKGPQGEIRVHFDRLGGKDPWTVDRYLNIWVCDMGGGFLGRATLPGTANFPEEDGVVIDYRYFGTIGTARQNPPYHLGRTCTHEIGHYFNLLHTWGDDGGTCELDDLVEDTPLQGLNYSGCPSWPQESCGSRDMFMNFMDRVDDGCMHFFTAGQKMRMRAALELFRPGLLQGAECPSIDDPGRVVLELRLLNTSDALRVLFDAPLEGKAEIFMYNFLGQEVFSREASGVHVIELPKAGFAYGPHILRVRYMGIDFSRKIMIF
jgi:hypothetical protein